MEAKMPSVRATGFPARQRGATLVIALLILVLIMMIGITAVSTSDTQFKLAGNLQFEDSALNNAETAVAAAENWLSTGTNFSSAGFSTYDRVASAHLLPIGHLAAQVAVKDRSALSMEWFDSVDDASKANSVSVTNPLTAVRNPSQRYFIELMSTDNRLLGSGVGLGKGSSGCNKVNLYQITGRGVSARGATKLVQSFYSVLSC